MTTSLPELKFRRWLSPVMAPFWDFTWHEDKEITPGVPDLHYVMNEHGFDHRVGWLELKASDKKLTASNRIKVEPSQHRYIEKWGRKMPIHFLIRVVDHIYVVEGKAHAHLSNFIEHEGHLSAISVLHFQQKDTPFVLPPFLRGITRI